VARKAKARKQIKRGRQSFTKFVSVFREEVELKAFECNKEIAQAYAKEAKQIIEGQLYNWTPLSRRYLEYKISRGYDARIYIRSGEFLSSVSWGVTHGRVWTGIPSRKMYTGRFERADEPERKRFPMRVLARWLEYGTTHRQEVEIQPGKKGRAGKKVYKTVIIPPRPIWRPLLAKFMQQKPKFGKRYRKALAQATQRRVRAGR
jgi:hypothetical protein